MTTAAILALIEGLTTALPAALELAASFKATASDTDQASISAAIAQLQAAANADLTTAEADLDAAAKL